MFAMNSAKFLLLKCQPYSTSILAHSSPNIRQKSASVQNLNTVLYLVIEIFTNGRPVNLGKGYQILKRLVPAYAFSCSFSFVHGHLPTCKTRHSCHLPVVVGNLVLRMSR